jgi:molybdopterin/thiamine biosynthesis adenylyltransferase
MEQQQRDRVTLDFTRQSTLIPAGISEMTTTIIGGGAIGSHTAECLAKIGIGTMHIWDDDTVESHNLPNQGFMLGDLGKLKVEALKERLEAGTGVQVTAHAERFVKGAFGTHVVISAVDSMAVRKGLFAAFLADPETKAFVDGRMGARFGNVRFVNKANPESIGKYSESLYDDASAFQEPCTARSTIFCAYGLSAIITGVLVNWALGEKVPLETQADFANFVTLTST